MENKLLYSEQVQLLSEVFDIDLSVLREGVPDEAWDEDCFLIDKFDFFLKRICVDKKKFIELDCVYQKNVFSIDTFPKAIPIEGKYPQLEVFYTSDDRHGFNYLYFDEEKKYLDVLSKLWAYSSIQLESDLMYIELPNSFGGFKKDDFFFKIEQAFTKEKIINIEEWEVLKYLLSLSLRDYVSLCVYFIDLKVVIWLKGLYCALYICDKEQEDFVRLICMTEGLYLRR